jgi:hypothetical protein
MVIMTQANEHPIAVPADLEAGQCHPRQDQAGSPENKRIEQLSETLRTHTRIVRQSNSSAYLYHRNELAVWLGQDAHLLDEVLDFMLARGLAGQFGLPDTWWIR